MIDALAIAQPADDFLSSSRNSGGMMIVIGRPMASSAVNPKMRPPRHSSWQ